MSYLRYSNVRANFSKVSNYMHILYANLLIFEKFALGLQYIDDEWEISYFTFYCIIHNKIFSLVKRNEIPIVGIVVTISPNFNLYNIVVFPDASNPI
jgi:hypothetical protein